MPKEELGKSFVNEFVIGLGFLSGLWIHVGIDPEAEVIKALASVVQTLSPNSGFSFLFWLLPIIATIGSIFAAFALGGIAGIIAVVLALLSGIFINSGFGVFLLVIAVILGFAAPYIKE